LDFGLEYEMKNMTYQCIRGKIKNSSQKNGARFLLIIVTLCTIILLSATSDTFQSSQTTSQAYKLANASSIGLKTYVEFTRNQFLIINHSAFDWTNVKFEVKATPVSDDSSEEMLKSEPVVFNVPRIRAGGTYTVSATPLAAGDRPRAQTAAPMPYHLDISCDTPQGQSFWSGHWQ
jgi:hypothetical protein